MSNPNIRNVGKRFSSEYQPKKNGRKPKIYSKAFRDKYNLGASEFREICMYILQLNKKEIEDLSKSEDTPIWIVNICRALYKDSGNGVTFTIRELIDRCFGKTLQPLQVENITPEPLQIEIINNRNQVENNED